MIKPQTTKERLRKLQEEMVASANRFAEHPGVLSGWFVSEELSYWSREIGEVLDAE
jgi:hypothetical protein